MSDSEKWISAYEHNLSLMVFICFIPDGKKIIIFSVSA